MIKSPLWVDARAGTMRRVPWKGVSTPWGSRLADGARLTIVGGGCMAIPDQRRSVSGERTKVIHNGNGALLEDANTPSRDMATVTCTMHGGGDTAIPTGSGDVSPSRSFGPGMVTSWHGLPIIHMPFVVGCSNIASSWEKRSVGISNRMRRFITRMGYAMTTALRISNCGNANIQPVRVRVSIGIARPVLATDFFRAS